MSVRRHGPLSGGIALGIAVTATAVSAVLMFAALSFTSGVDAVPDGTGERFAWLAPPLISMCTSAYAIRHAYLHLRDGRGLSRWVLGLGASVFVLAAWSAYWLLSS